MPTHAFTIRRLADAAGISVETVRHYRRRGLLDGPPRVESGFREFSEQDTALALPPASAGFRLLRWDAIAELASLNEHKEQARARGLARITAPEIRRRVVELESMAAAREDRVACYARSALTAPRQTIAAWGENRSRPGPSPEISCS